MASNWLNPVQDFLAASKSGADAGLALARIQNDKSEAAAKLAQAAQSEEDQNALGYAQLSAKKDEAGQSAAEKLQAAMAQQSALNQWRNDKLDQGQQKIDLSGANTGSLIDTRAAKLLQGDTRLDQGQQKIDMAGDKLTQQADQFAQKLAANKLWREAQYGGGKMTQVEKGLFDQALNHQTAATKTLMQPYADPHTSSTASNILQQTQSVIDSFKLKYPGKTAATGSASAADALTGATPAPDAANQRVRVKSPEGKIGSIPANQLDDAIKSGYEQVQ